MEKTIRNEENELIVLDDQGMEVRSDEEDPTESDIEFIATEEEVEADILLSDTMGSYDQEEDTVLTTSRLRLRRQSSQTIYDDIGQAIRELYGQTDTGSIILLTDDESDDYEPSSSDDAN